MLKPWNIAESCIEKANVLLFLLFMIHVKGTFILNSFVVIKIVYGNCMLLSSHSNFDIVLL